MKLKNLIAAITLTSLLSSAALAKEKIIYLTNECFFKNFELGLFYPLNESETKNGPHISLRKERSISFPGIMLGAGIGLEKDLKYFTSGIKAQGYLFPNNIPSPIGPAPPHEEKIEDSPPIGIAGLIQAYIAKKITSEKSTELELMLGYTLKHINPAEEYQPNKVEIGLRIKLN